ncbi:MAG: hypothetical protein WCF62_00795, partial [Pseudolabrys sp.]
YTVVRVAQPLDQVGGLLAHGPSSIALCGCFLASIIAPLGSEQFGLNLLGADRFLLAADRFVFVNDLRRSA